MSVDTQEAPTETYAEKKLGMWSGMFNEEAMERLNKLFATYDATITPEDREVDRMKFEEARQRALNAGAKSVSEYDPDPEINWLLDEAERLGLCTSEEAADLRDNFVMPSNGLPIVLNLP